MNRRQRRASPRVARAAPYAALVAENARLRQDLAEAREQLAEWRFLLVENDLIEPTPREDLRQKMEFWGWPFMYLDSGRWVGGCEHAWAELLCHGLTDDEVSELSARDGSDGLEHGADPSEITPADDPRCDGCAARVLATVAGGSE